MSIKPVVAATAIPPFLQDVFDDPTYRSFLRLRDLECLGLILLGEIIADTHLCRRLQEMGELEGARRVAEWLVDHRDLIAEVSPDRREHAVAVKRVEVEDVLLKICLRITSDRALLAHLATVKLHDRIGHVEAAIHFSRAESSGAYRAYLAERRKLTPKPAPLRPVN